ncbi:hypothetical protein BVY02_00240 [bacterium J17]|nr:hypothetical protein BVY02_00240 [bacterium J17]
MYLYRSVLKRVFDLVIALCLGLLLVIPCILIAILIRIDSPGSPIFRQRRIGQKGQIFTMYKFRSMVSGADEIGPYSTAPGDSRITKFGAFLRRTSLDELPQLWNIIRGDMSLIGPRPDVPAQRTNYNDREFLERHAVRPGVTGLAQVSNRHGGTEELRKKYDIFYARKLSLALDIKIGLKTIKVLLKGSY